MRCRAPRARLPLVGRWGKASGLMPAPHLTTQWSGRPTAQARLLGVASYLWAAAHRQRSAAYLKRGIMPNENAPRVLPSEIIKRRKSWQISFWLWATVHYMLGTIGIVASGFASADKLQPWSSILAGACLGFIGFANPLQRYNRYVNAWRVLDIAMMRARDGDAAHKELIDAVERGEHMFAEAEKEDSGAPPDDKSKKT